MPGINVLFLAKLADECSSEKDFIDINAVLKHAQISNPADITVKMVRKYLVQVKSYQILEFSIDAKAAVNNQFVAEDALVNIDDELAFLPPFSGG